MDLLAILLLYAAGALRAPETGSSPGPGPAAPPAIVQPAAAEPAAVEPAPAAPDSGEPARVQPAPVEPSPGMPDPGGSAPIRLPVPAMLKPTPPAGFKREAARRAAERRRDPWGEHIAEASARFGLPEEWIRAVIQVESGGRTKLNGKPITSPAGAMGLMQVMPQTYALLRPVLQLGADPHDPRDNILAGTAYLRALYDCFGWPGLFAAYNAGPARFETSLRKARPLPRETRRYLSTLGEETEHPADGTMPPYREPRLQPALVAATGLSLLTTCRGDVVGGATASAATASDTGEMP